MENKKMGRPIVAASKRKKLQYSVWVNAIEKKEIDLLISSSNLSASQWFLTHAINKPIERPKKKNLPPNVAKQITNLEKLSGLLSMAVLKTNSKEMISLPWQQSSQTVKDIIRLVLLHVFIEFDLPNITILLNKLSQNSEVLIHYLEIVKVDEEILSLVKHNYQEAQKLKYILFKQYTEALSNNQELLWKSEHDIHLEIQKIKSQI